MQRIERSEYRIIKGGVPRTVRGVEAKRRVDRELHGIVVQTPVPKAHQDFMHDLRRERRRVYGSLLRYLDIAVMQGVSRATLMKIPMMLAFYITDLTDARDGITSEIDRDAIENQQPPRAA